MSGDEALIASVVDQLPLGVWIARVPDGELVFANQMFREIMGIEARTDVAVGGWSEPYGIHGRDGARYPEHRMPFLLAIEARRTITVDDIVIHRRDGGRVNIRATARPIFGGDAITHVVIAFADITAEVEAEAARRAGEERLRHAQRLEALGNLAAGVAHDFNNLLASIGVLSSLLRLRELDPGRIEDLRQIEATTRRAAELAHSLLAFGRQGGGTSTRLDVDVVTERIVELLQRTFPPAIEIALIPSGGAAQIVGDRAQLEQILMNLAVNARDAMPTGGRIVFRIGVDREAATIEVEDTGPGVPEELRERIFEPYFTTRTDRDVPGTGLGLATVYGIVQGHGGTIEVDSAVPHGARFRVSLPAALGVGHGHGRPAPGPAGSGSSSLIRGTGTVLIVDDDDAVRVVMRRALETLGYAVIEARDGVAAIEAFRIHRRALRAVVLDVLMPRLGGHDVLAALRQLDDSVPVVATSGRMRPGEATELLALGVRGLLPKPFDVAALSTAVARAIAS